jgi:CBS domain-containing protein
MNGDPRERIDVFPYRHRLEAVMRSPVVSAEPGLSLGDAATRMLQATVSSLLLLDAAGKPAGIFTEHDLLEAIAAKGPAALEAPLVAHTSRPVETLPSDAFVYRALGRMDRLDIRHVVVVDPDSGRAVGVVSARGLLKQRAGRSLALGDEISIAADGRALAAVHSALPDLARELMAEGLEARAVCGVISAAIRDISGRAAELAAESLELEGRHAPARWCYLVLGSGGRGESQLIPDQDNALVHDGSESDDPWFAELGKRASDILDQAGIAYCKGKVMASNAVWRGSLTDWRRRIDGWIAHPKPENLLSVDIFYDFQPVFGDRALAWALRDCATGAARSRPFLVMLTGDLGESAAALGFFGSFRTKEGRLDLKRYGLLPIVAGARMLALSLGTMATSTVDRLEAARSAGIVNDEDADTLEQAQSLFLGCILQQQLIDIAAGLAPTVKVDVRRLKGSLRRQIKEALRRTAIIQRLVQDALSANR